MKENIDKYLSLDIETLYLEIGKNLTGKTAFPLNKEYAIKLARVWYNEQSQKFAELICNNKNIRELIQNKQNKILLVSAIADLLSSILSVVPAVTVAVLIIKEGLETLCSKKWNSKN